jgi:hypothetical protein
MKRAVLIVAVAALCVAGSAVAQDRSGGLIGSGTRAEDSGQMMGSGNVADQMMGSGGFTTSTQDQYLGNGGRSEDGRQILGSGGLIGSGTRAEDSGQVFGSGAGETSQDGGYLIGGGRGGYFGSGLSVRELRLLDGSSLLIVSSDEGVFVIQIEE